MPSPTDKPLSCRLCEGSLTFKFSCNVLGRHDVRYFQCAACQCLQTEPPYWLDEAYGPNNLSNLDTGAVQRNLHNLAACYAISKIFGAHHVVDMGGGDGLLCRMLRDIGLNCFVKDKYASPTYAQGFTTPDFATPDLVLAFEVLEHFPNPKADLDALLGQGSKAVLLSTARYEDQGADWWYLEPHSGQHVFFYSKKALSWIGEKYGYTLITRGTFILYLKNASSLQMLLAKIALRSRISRWLRAFVVLRPSPGVWADHELQLERSKRAQGSQ